MVRQFSKFNVSIIKKIFLIKTRKKLVRSRLIFKKSSNIPYSFSGFRLDIYKGNLFKSLKINKFMFNLVLGSFVFTRKPHTFISKKKKKANNVRR